MQAHDSTNEVHTKGTSVARRGLWVVLLALVCSHGAVRAGFAAATESAAANPPRGAAPIDANTTTGSGRVYTKPSEQQLRRLLAPLAYEVTQNAATEPAFHNAFWDHHEAGLYVDAVSGEPLFSSIDKFDSGTGWPSFTRPVEAGRVVARPEPSLRIEVLSQAANSHLGHVFEDGPPPGGLRYCINSAALRFVPVRQLAEQGYPEYVSLFSGQSTKITTASSITTNSCTAPALGEKPGCEASLDVAVLAGGCFWGMEEILRKIPGVVSTEVGYTGGTTPDPRYEDVSTGTTGHAEAVRVVFDPTKLTYSELLEKWFFRMHDPTTENRQGSDVGTQYRSAIFATSAEQRRVAEEVRQRVDASGKWGAVIVTAVVDAGVFTLAEEEHQHYLQKHPTGYTCHYLRD